MKFLFSLLTSLACINLALSSTLMAQKSVLAASATADTPVALDTSAHSIPITTSSIPVSKLAKTPSLTGRWLDLETFSHSERFRSAFQTGY